MPRLSDRPAAPPTPTTGSSKQGPDLFDRWSGTYDRRRLQQLTYRPIHDAMLARLKTLEPTTILDLGCGTGQFLPRLRSAFPDAGLIGVDLSEGMLARANERFPSSSTGEPRRGGLLRSDAMALPVCDGSIDVITCSESFHWYPDQKGALEEIARVLTPGGRLIIASIATTTTLGSTGVRLWSEAFGQPIRAIPPRSLSHMLKGGGFEVLAQRRLPRFGLVPWPVLTDARRRPGGSRP